MRIYSKKNFTYGLLLTLLGIVSLILNFIKGFRVKSCILLALCIYFGIGIIIRSISREMTKEDILNDLDERNQYINLKSRSKSFGLIKNISFIIMLLLFITAKMSDNQLLFYVGIGFYLNFVISIIVEFCTTFYYENKN